MWLTTLHLLELQKKAEPETVGGCATHGAIDSAVDDIAQDQEGDQPQIEAAGDEGGEEAHEPQLLSKALREASSTALEREGGCTGGEERVAGQWRDGRLGRGQRLAKLGLATYSHFLSASQTPASPPTDGRVTTTSSTSDFTLGRRTSSSSSPVSVSIVVPKAAVSAQAALPSVGRTRPPATRTPAQCGRAPTAATAGAGGEEAADGSSSDDGGAAKGSSVDAEVREVGRGGRCCGCCCCCCCCGGGGGGETSSEAGSSPSSPPPLQPPPTQGGGALGASGRGCGVGCGRCGRGVCAGGSSGGRSSRPCRSAAPPSRCSAPRGGESALATATAVAHENEDEAPRAQAEEARVSGVGRSVGRSVGRLVGRSIGRSVSRSVRLSVSRLFLFLMLAPSLSVPGKVPPSSLLG